MIAVTRSPVATNSLTVPGFGAVTGDAPPLFGALLADAGGVAIDPEPAIPVAAVAVPAPVPAPAAVPVPIPPSSIARQDDAVDGTALPPVVIQPNETTADPAPIVEELQPRMTMRADDAVLPLTAPYRPKQVTYRTAPLIASAEKQPDAAAPATADENAYDDVAAIPSISAPIIALAAPLPFVPVPADGGPLAVATAPTMLLGGASVNPEITARTTATGSVVTPLSTEAAAAVATAPVVTAFSPAMSIVPRSAPPSAVPIGPQTVPAAPSVRNGVKPVLEAIAPIEPTVVSLEPVTSGVTIVATGSTFALTAPVTPNDGKVAYDRMPTALAAQPVVDRAAVAPAPTLPIVQGPAAQVFGAAIAAARRDDRTSRDDRGGDALSLQPAAEIARATVAATADAQQAPLDMNQQRWPHAMVDRIAQLRDAAAAVSASAAETRIRLVPDALGAIDVAIVRDGDAVSVRFQADQPATRALLQDAQGRLADIAESRGLRLAGSSVDAGGTGSGQQHQPQQPQPTFSRTPRRATTDLSTTDTVTADAARVA